MDLLIFMIKTSKIDYLIIDLKKPDNLGFFYALISGAIFKLRFTFKTVRFQKQN